MTVSNFHGYLLYFKEASAHRAVLVCVMEGDLYASYGHQQRKHSSSPPALLTACPPACLHSLGYPYPPQITTCTAGWLADYHTTPHHYLHYWLTD